MTGDSIDSFCLLHRSIAIHRDARRRAIERQWTHTQQQQYPNKTVVADRDNNNTINQPWRAVTILPPQPSPLRADFIRYGGCAIQQEYCPKVVAIPLVSLTVA